MTLPDLIIAIKEGVFQRDEFAKRLEIIAQLHADELEAAHNDAKVLALALEKAEAEVVRLSVEVAEALKCMEWLPMDTAPRDGSIIIIGSTPSEESDGVSTVGSWLDMQEDGVDYMGNDAGFCDYEFQVFNPGKSFGNRKFPASQPTHWKPLPPPPTT